MPFFSNAKNVDTRGSIFTSVNGDQVNFINGHQPQSAYDMTGPPSFTSGYNNPPFWADSRSDRSYRSQSAWPQSFHPELLVDREMASSEDNGPVQQRSHQSARSSTRSSTIPLGSEAQQSRQIHGRSNSLDSDFLDAFIHIKQPSAEVSQWNKALISFETDISPWKDPSKWIDADNTDIQSIIEKATGKIEGITQAKFGQTMVYPRLIVYIFINIADSPENKSLMNEVKTTLNLWQTWDSITILQNHQSIKDFLWHIFQQALPLDLRAPFIADYQRLIELGALRLCAQLAVMVMAMDLTKCKELINTERGVKALINLLQARLDFPIEPQFKSRHVKTLIRMCRASGFYPECMVLNGVEKEGNPVAAGGFGDVYKGKIKGSRPGQKNDIAIKVLKVYQNSNIEKVIKSFVTEAVTWKQLSHPNVLPIYGIYHLNEDKRSLCFACPWMENGNIINFLSRTENENVDCVPLVLDVAQGLSYLHSQRIVHGDLKGLNILVSNSGRALLADFGLAAIDSTTMMTLETQRGTGTLRWQAPELLGNFLNSGSDDTPQRNTTATDIYAFAFVCYEIFTGEVPFINIMNDFQVTLAVLNGQRPTRPRSSIRGLNDSIWNLIEKCWSQEGADRPTVDKVLEGLRALPNRPDERPVDNFDFPSGFWGNQAKNPFSVLAYSKYIETLPSSGTVISWDSDIAD